MQKTCSGFSFQVMRENFDRDWKNACAKTDSWTLSYAKAMIMQALNLLEAALDKMFAHIQAFKEPLKRTTEEYIILNVGRSVLQKSSSITRDLAKGFKQGLNMYVPI